MELQDARLAEQSTDSFAWFDALPAAAQVQTDRYCTQCGYNLLTQPVRRDTRTNVLLVRCPECGGFEAAADAGTVRRVWLERLGKVLLMGWMLGLCGLIIWLGVLHGVLSYLTLDGLTTWRSIAQQPASVPAPVLAQQIAIAQPGGNSIIVPLPPGASLLGRPITLMSQTTTYAGGFWRNRQLVVREKWDEYGLFMSTMSAVAAAVSFLLALVAAVFFCHWRRWAYFPLVYAAPLIAAVIVWLIWREEAPHLISWGGGYIGYFAMIELCAGTAGIFAGRPLVRLMANLMLPPRPRQFLTFLWLVDGKQPPPAILAPNHRATTA